jgi:hypothetical protein
MTPRLLKALWRALSRFCRYMTTRGSGASAQDVPAHPAGRALRRRIEVSDDPAEVNALFWEMLAAERERAIDEERR